MATNVSNAARTAQWGLEDDTKKALAIKMATDPMLRNAEVQSGMVQGANVLQNTVIPGTLSGDIMSGYYDKLATDLPKYTNAYRAYLEEQRKKAAASASSGFDLSGLGTINYIMPTQGGMFGSPYYVPPDTPVGEVPYRIGAMPMGSDVAQLAKKLAANKLPPTKSKPTPVPGKLKQGAMRQ